MPPLCMMAASMTGGKRRTGSGKFGAAPASTVCAKRRPLLGDGLVVRYDRLVLALQGETATDHRDHQIAERHRRRVAKTERSAVDESEKRQHGAGAGIDRGAIEPAIDDKGGEPRRGSCRQAPPRRRVVPCRDRRRRCWRACRTRPSPPMFRPPRAHRRSGSGTTPRCSVAAPARPRRHAASGSPETPVRRSPAR